MLALPPLPPSVAVLQQQLLRRTDQVIVLQLSNPHPAACCPVCHQPSGRLQSYYRRTLADVPCGGVAVRLVLRVRRWWCDNGACPQRIFSEPFAGLVRRYGRRTERLQAMHQAVGFALGGEAGARLAQALGMPISADTLLRQLHQAPVPMLSTPRVLGVDDWAYRRGHRYGTILVDLERHRPVELLPDREAQSLAQWLKAHPGVEIISRDRAEAYAKGARAGAPSACQVADRWHVVKNLRDSVQLLLTRHQRQLQQVAQAQAADGGHASPPAAAPPSATLPAARLSPVERVQAARRQRRLARYRKVCTLRHQGLAIRAIAQRLGLGRNTVRRYVRARRFPERARREGRISPFLDYLRQRWDGGCRSARALWHELRERGFRGSASTVRRTVQRWRRTAPQDAPAAQRAPVTAPSPRQVSWWLLGLAKDADHAPTAAQQRFVEALCQRCPAVRRARELASGFIELLKQHQAGRLGAWLLAAKASGLVEIVGFAQGVLNDKQAVSAALTSPWSNGQVEGQINRLKTLKRQMYGRASFQLLRTRVLHQATGTARGPPHSAKVRENPKCCARLRKPYRTLLAELVAAPWSACWHRFRTTPARRI